MVGNCWSGSSVALTRKLWRATFAFVAFVLTAGAFPTQQQGTQSAARCDRAPENLTPTSSTASGTGPFVSVSIMVRTTDGTPVRGLTADDFTIKEEDRSYRVEVVHPLLEHASGDRKATEQISTSDRKDEVGANAGDGRRNQQKETQAPTYLLMLLPPMNPSARSYALNSSVTHLQRVAGYGWYIALLDPSGTFAPPTQDFAAIIEKLTKLKTRRDPTQYGGAWIDAARRTVRQLSALPGRHVILLPCDTEREELDREPNSVMRLPRNPWKLRVSPSLFEDDARFAMAQMYTIQASGPGVVIPFGGAGSGGGATDPVNPGPDIVQQLSDDGSYLAAQRAELMGVADRTGGRAELDVDDALKDVAKDASGYYELHFRPDPAMADGSYHPIRIETRSSQLHVFASPWYLAPAPVTSKAGLVIPRVLWNALKSERRRGEITVVPKAWYFPIGGNGLATVPLAAEVALPFTSREINVVQLAAIVIDERQGKVIDTASMTLRWKGDKSGLRRTVWSKTLRLPPGSYELRVAAFDPDTKAAGTGSWRFLIHSPDSEAQIMVSSLLLANSCELPSEKSTGQDLFDPLIWKECHLVPAVSSTFREDQTLRVLLRLYSAINQEKTFPRGWTARVSIWETQKGIPITLPVRIEPSSGPGWAAFAEISFAKLRLAPGDYQINMTLQGPKVKQTFSVQAHLEIVPNTKASSGEKKPRDGSTRTRLAFEVQLDS
jgi:hypothetical protein